MRTYNISLQTYFRPGSIPMDRELNGFTVKNVGTTNVLINSQIVIVPGESFSVGGNEGEIYAGRLDIKFQVPAPPPGTIVNAACVVQKYYTEGRGYDPVKI